MTILIGPAGLGGVNEAERNLEKFKNLGLTACEISFTYGIYMKNKEDSIRIGKKAKELGIQLSIHAPYWINLNSAEREKIESSKKRIVDCCQTGELLGAKYVVFHPGYYGKDTPEKAYQKIKEEIIEIQKIIKKNRWKIQLAPETTGKINVFGKEEEILRLVEETGCFFTLDFSHLLARSRGKMEYGEMIEKVKKFEALHCHFSGIEWGEKGERKHKKLETEEIKKLVAVLPKNKKISLINESPDSVKDATRILEIIKSH
jgi:deoxyribonuclease IV